MIRLNNRKVRKIALVCPPYVVSRFAPKRVQSPLGAAYLAACFEREGYDVKVIDAVIEGWGRKKYRNSRLIQWGLTVEEVLKRILEYVPDIVGISCLFAVQSHFVMRLSKLIKKANPEIIVMIGGAHPTACHERMMANPCIDFIVLGEGEETAVRLVKRVESDGDFSGLDGIAFRNGNKVCTNHKKSFIENLDALPFPAWHLLPMDKYYVVNRPHGVWSTARHRASMITSRGCPAQCVFCSIHGLWGRRYRARGVENIIEEMRYLKEGFGIEEICFEDDNLTFDKERARQLFDRILEEKFNFSFIVPNGVAIWSLDEDLLERMRACGFHRLTLAVESGSQEVLNRIIHKPLKLSQVEKVIKAAKRLGFSIDTFYVIGFPGETLEQMEETFRFSRGLDVDSSKYFIATPYPGTPLYRLCQQKNYFAKERISDWRFDVTEPLYDTEHFSREELKETFMRENLKSQLITLLRHPLRTSGDSLRFVMQNPYETFAFLASALCKKG